MATTTATAGDTVAASESRSPHIPETLTPVLPDSQESERESSSWQVMLVAARGERRWPAMVLRGSVVLHGAKAGQEQWR